MYAIILIARGHIFKNPLFHKEKAVKEKLVKSLKNLVWLLMVVGVVGTVVAISVRFFAVVRTINSNKLMNAELLPETYIYNRYWKIEKEFLQKWVSELRGRVDETKESLQKLKKKFQIPHLQEVSLLMGEVDKLSNKVDGINELIQQLQRQSQLPKLEELAKLQREISSLFDEFSEIQTRIEKLEKDTSVSSAP